MSDTDIQLLARDRRYHAEDAFAEIVRRHIGLVYSAALRQVRSPQLAEEVAQSVFTSLARDAERLRPDTILTAWLYQVTHHTAANVVRGEVRRQLREQIATEMNAMNATAADWTHIEPLLDEAMHALDETDRVAVLLHYFENNSLREVGQALGASENAAQTSQKKDFPRTDIRISRCSVSLLWMKSKLLTCRTSAWAIALGLCLWTVGCATNRPRANPSEVRVDPLFNAWNRPDSPGAAIVVVKDGAVVYQRGYGCANLDYGVPITTQTVFDAASVAKQFTGLAIAMLIDQGKLSLDDDIRTHLPEVPDFGTPITIRHLLHHTSGLRDWPVALALSGTAWSDLITTEKILEMVRHQRELNFPPGESSLYSNTGYNLLAAVVAKVSGQSFRAWTQTNLFQPLDMKHTHFCDDPTEAISQRAESYVSAGKAGHRHVVSQLSALGSSSLMTTVEDMGKWLINLETARVGGRAAIEAMKQRGRLNSGTNFAYGFGLGLDPYHDLEAESHGGGWAGFRSAVLSVPAKRFGVAVLSNVAHLDAERLAKKVADVFLGYQPEAEPAKTPSKPPPATKIDPLTFPQYVGDYWSEELQVAYQVEVRQGKLMISHRLRGSAGMMQRDPDRFDTEKLPEIDLEVSIEFVRNAESEVVGFKLSARRLRNLWFTRAVLPKAGAR
jgi:RNA polymerase sigma factor (sigma-70 family)